MGINIVAEISRYQLTISYEMVLCCAHYHSFKSGDSKLFICEGTAYASWTHWNAIMCYK